jgi:transposase
MHSVDHLSRMNADELREFAASLIDKVARLDSDNARLGSENRLKQLKIDQLTHEMAMLRRWKFAASSEQLQGEQKMLFEEMLDADLEAIGLELEALRGRPAVSTPKEQPKRAALPQSLPRREIRHEPDSTTCGCGCAMKRIGEDVSEKLDYVPGTFTVERHVRGKWACVKCQILIQAPVPAQVIDKGIPTAGLLAQVLVSKYSDHAPLYRQEQMFGRAGLAIPRSTLGAWVGACGVRLQPLVDALREVMLGCAVLHADETPVAMLAPGKGHTHRAYLWSYGTTQFDVIRAVVYDFAEGRAGRHAKAFLEGWRGTLVCDDYSG